MRIPTVIRLHLLATACAAALLAHGLPGQLFTPPTLAQDRTEAPTPVGWSGEGVAGTPLADMRIAYPDPHEVDQALARVETLAQVQRDWSAAEAAVDRLWLRANYAKYYDGTAEAYLKTLLRVTRRAAGLRAAQGKYEEALELVEVPYLHAGHPLVRATGIRLAELPDWLAQALAAWQPDNAWRSIQADLRTGMEQEPEQGHLIPGLDEDDVAYLREHFGLPSPELWNRVEDALQRGDSPFIHSLGLRAAAALAALTLADPDGLESGHTVDPFVALASVDGPGACRMAVDYFDQEGQGFRLRVLAALEQEGTLDSNSAWDWGDPRQLDPPRCREPHWLDMVAVLVAEARTRNRVMNLVGRIAERDALTPSLQESLSEFVRSADATQIKALFRVMPMTTPTDSMRTVLEAALGHEDVTVRILAADALAYFPASDRLLGASGDPSHEVRRHVLAGLRPKWVQTRSYGLEVRSAPGSNGYRRSARTDARARAVLLELLEDPHPVVRRDAALALAASQWGIDSEAPFLEAASVADVHTAGALLGASHLNEEIRRVTLYALAERDDPQVLAVIDAWLASREPWRSEPVLATSLLGRRAQHPTYPFMSGIEPEDVPDWLRGENLMPGQSRIAKVFDFVVRFDDATRAAAFDLGLALEDAGVLDAIAADRVDAYPFLLQQSSDDLLQAVRITLTKGASPGDFLGTVGNAFHMQGSSGHDLTAWISLLKEDQLPIAVRSDLCQILVRANVPGSERPVLEYLYGDWASTAALDHSDWIDNLTYEDPTRHHAFLESALDVPEGESAVTAALLLTFRHAADPRVLAPAVVDPEIHGGYLYLPDAWRAEVATSAWRLMSEDGWSDEERKLLIANLKSEVEQFVRAASDAALTLDDPAMIPIVGEMIRGTSDSQRQVLLIPVIARSMTREAGQELVQCLGAAASGSVRNQILEALANIRQYLDQKQYWETDPARETTEGEAIAELVVMLDDASPQIRTAAVLGLGSFGAREYLPRIIRMLEDEDEQVRKAARQTLGRFGVDPASLEGDGDE